MTFEFSKNTETIRAAVFQALGYASTCWQEDGTFNDVAAMDCGEKLLTFINNYEVPSKPKTGDRVEDGGEMGTLVRCYECGGGGLLHQLDEIKPGPEPMTPSELKWEKCL